MERAADEDRIGDLVRRCVAGKHVAEPETRRPVDDESVMLSAAERRRDQHRPRVDRTAQNPNLRTADMLATIGRAPLSQA
jgi:hypothetical protein